MVYSLKNRLNIRVKVYTSQERLSILLIADFPKVFLDNEMGGNVAQPEESSSSEPWPAGILKQPNYYGQESSNVVVPQSPITYKEAIIRPDKNKKGSLL